MDFRKCNREKVFRYSIRKYHFGAASVAVAALMFLGARASVVQADTTVNATEVSLESSEPKSDPAAEGASEASNGSERSADQTSNSVQRTPVGSDRDASPSSNNGESSEGSDRSNSSAVSGRDRSAEETSNSGQHAPAGSERSAGEGPNTVSRSSQRTPTRRARSVGEDRASKLNGQYVYGVNQRPVPDDKFNDRNYLLEHWAEGMFNWLEANAKPGVFELYYDNVLDEWKIRRRQQKAGVKRDQLYRDEATTDGSVLNIFSQHKDATHLTLNFVPGGDGQVTLRIIGANNQELGTVSIPKEDIWIRQSDYETKQREIRRQEAETGPAKTAAKAALAEAVEAEKNEINADKSLTKEAKAEKLKELEAKQREEEAKIDSAEDADKVAEAKTAGETAVKAVHDNGDLGAVKTAAKAALAEAVEAEKNEINADKSL
ncbi:YSIRK-type signal peptide-containing protein, partial [Streptococcus pseudopneumoniae]